MSFYSEKPRCEELEKSAGSLQTTLCVLGDKWSPLLLGQLVNGEKTFTELEKLLNGISPRTLSARLEKLGAAEIISKQLYVKHPPRYNYQLTKKGLELTAILKQMVLWGEKHKTS